MGSGGTAPWRGERCVPEIATLRVKQGGRGEAVGHAHTQYGGLNWDTYGGTNWDTYGVHNP